MTGHLAPNRAYGLLDSLCTKLGFCLPADDRVRLAERPPETVEAFTDAVFTAEGLDPVLADGDLYRQVSSMVERAFRAAEDEAKR